MDQIKYGNWFERKSPGVWKLTLLGTIGGLAGLVAVIFISPRFNSIPVTVLMIIGVVVFEALFGWEYDGKTPARRIAERRDVPRREKTGETIYITGALASLEGAHGGHPLPGVLADTELLPARDGYGNPFVVIHYRSKGLFAVTFRCYPEGDSMNDQDVVDMMVAKYGAWISTLSVEEGVVGASTIIDSAPGTGVELAETVLSSRSEEAPAAASQIMDAVTMTPGLFVDITGYVTIVWRASAMSTEHASVQDVVVEIEKRLPSHQAALAAAGAGDPTPMTEAELVEVAQVAYDPELAVQYDTLRARGEVPGLRWRDAGPSFGAENRGAFRHDGAASYTLEMRRPPRGGVFDTHLLRMLQPNPAFLRHRVAVFYQAVAADKAQSSAENAVRSEDWAANQKRGRRTASTRQGIAVAANLDAEIGRGAALVPFAMLATCTYDDTPEAERRAHNTLSDLMVAARMRVRRSKGLQAPLFHMTLPFGILPWEFTDNPLKR